MLVLFRNPRILTLIDALELRIVDFNNLLGRFNSQELYSRCRARKGWEKVNYYGQVSRVEMYRIASTSDIAVTLFHPEPNHLEALPNKIFEYFAARKPVLISDFPFWRSEFSSYKGVHFTNPKSPEDIASDLVLLRNMKKELKHLGDSNHSTYMSDTWENEAQGIKLYSLLQEKR